MQRVALTFLILFFVFFQSRAQKALTPELMWTLSRVSPEIVSVDGKSVYFGISNTDMKANKNERNIYSIAVNGGGLKQITKDAGNETDLQQLSNGKILYTYKGQIWIMNADGDKPEAITKGEQNYSTLKISPDGRKILFSRDVKVRKTSQDIYPDLDKANARIIDNLMYRHWADWEDESVSHIFIADFDGKTLSNEKDIMQGEEFDCPQQPEGGPEDVIWSTDCKSIYYVCKKKTGKEYSLSTNTDIYVYDIASGKTTNFTEGLMGYDTSPLFSNDGKKIIWLSMATEGYEADKNDILLYDFTTKKRTNLTKSWDGTAGSIRFSTDSKKIYFTADVEATEQIFEIALPDNQALTTTINIKQLTTGEFDITGMVGQSGNTMVVSRTDMNHAAELFTVDLNSGAVTPLTHVNAEAYSKIKMCKVEKHWVTSTDKQKMLVWVIYPPDFSPDKKYPALLYCQGGPQSAVSQFYSFRWNFQLMASQGYIVVAPNRHGLPGFGVKWNESISKNWGDQPIQDYLTAIDSVSALPFIDKSRVGAIGASYGGYSVYMLEGVHNGRFKTFIAHCGLFDLKSWYLTTDEMWFANWDIGGPFWDKSAIQSYEKYDPIQYADKWNTPILVIHGGADYRVPENQGMEAFQLAQLKGIKSKLLFFPNEGHWILRPQDGLLWQREFYKWLDETL